MATNRNPALALRAPQPSSAQPARTQTQTQTNHTPLQPVLHLRGAHEEIQDGQSRRRIQWAEDVVDNEGMGKKSSKVCCIYHAPKQNIDDSSDESSSDSSGSDTDSGDDGAARPSRKSGGRRVGGHGHDHGKAKAKGKGRERSPNAYEKIPKPRNSGGETKGT